MILPETRSLNYKKIWYDRFELFIPIGKEGDGFICSKIFGLEPTNSLETPKDPCSKNNYVWYSFVGILKTLTDKGNQSNRYTLNFQDALPLGGSRLLVTVLYDSQLYEMSCSIVSADETQDNAPYFYSNNKAKSELVSIFSRAISHCSPYIGYKNSNDPIILSIERLREVNYQPLYRIISDYRHYSFQGYYGEYTKRKKKKISCYHGIVCEISKKIQLFYSKETLSRTKYDREGNLYQDHDTYDYVGEIFFPTIYDMYNYINKAKKSGLCKLTMSDINRNKFNLMRTIREDFASNNTINFFNPTELPKLSLTTNNSRAYRSSTKERWATIGNGYSLIDCVRIIHIEMTNDDATILDVFPNMVFYFDSWYYDEI